MYCTGRLEGFNNTEAELETARQQVLPKTGAGAAHEEGDFQTYQAESGKGSP